MLTQSVQDHLKRYEDAATLTQEYDIDDIATDAMNECETVEDWQACLDAFGERIVGNYVADNADDEAFHPFDSEGIAAVYFGENKAIVSEWNNQGFYYVTLTSASKAQRAIDSANEDWHEAEPEEDEEETED